MSDAKKDPLPLAAQLTKGMDLSTFMSSLAALRKRWRRCRKFMSARNRIFRLRSSQSLSLSDSLLDLTPKG
jgi:hypothetical protein